MVSPGIWHPQFLFQSLAVLQLHNIMWAYLFIVLIEIEMIITTFPDTYTYIYNIYRPIYNYSGILPGREITIQFIFLTNGLLGVYKGVQGSRQH